MESEFVVVDVVKIEDVVVMLAGEVIANVVEV